jgi:hypothetical protein
MIDAFFNNRNQYIFPVGALIEVLSLEIISKDACGKRVGALIQVLSLEIISTYFLVERE